jgi:hypothetical protein
MPLQKLKGSADSGGASSKPLETCPLSKRFPTLAAFLSMTSWPDGEVRCTGTVTLLFEDGLCKAAINDRDASMSAFVSGKTLTSLLEALEKGLDTSSLEFRVKRDDRRGSGGKGR